jgi:hypothetical protein
LGPPLFLGARGALVRLEPAPASAPEPSEPAPFASVGPALGFARRDRPRPPRRRRDGPPPGVVAAAPSPVSPPCNSPCWPGCALCPSPAGGATGSAGLRNGGAGLVSPIFGLWGTAVALVPLANGPGSSSLRAPLATSAAAAARLGASGTDAGRPVVGSNIGEIPSKGRASKRRGRHSSSSTAASHLSGALGQIAETECESTFYVVSFAGPREGLGDVTVGDSENDVASYGRSCNRNGSSDRVRLC